MFALVLLVGMLEFLIQVLKLLNLRRQLQVITALHVIQAWTSRAELYTPANEVLLQGPVLLILTALHIIVGCLRVPMLLA